MKRTVVPVEKWRFALGGDASCLENAAEVRVPHTWSIDEKGQYYVGKGWYRTAVRAEDPARRTFLRFRGVYRDAEVYLGEELIARHLGSGYTPFTVELTEALAGAREGIVTVSADNSFSSAALPCARSFDWANDGGLYRPVELWQTGAASVEDLIVRAEPILPELGERREGGAALFGFRAKIDGPAAGCRLRWALHRGAEESVTPVAEEPLAAGEIPCAEETVCAPRLLEEAVYWHFDRPELYTLRVWLLGPDGAVSDAGEVVFGFRSLLLRGGEMFLNGESVRVPGMEWMPGSDPAFGAAEPREALERMLLLLRESNSVLTRFHWQQDDLVYDWCDRHGLLVQEEIPFWGKAKEADPEALWPVASAQLEEMIRAHRHHPSIVAWGVGNELAADRWEYQRYIRRAVALAHALDPSRPANYVTNTAWRCVRYDGAADGDILMINDYIGTWHQGLDQEGAWAELLDAHPGRAFVPSEFGLCEPAFSGGDAARERIFLEKTACYRPKKQIVGTVYFCLNDYRTHMGEEGEGRLCRRVHGSAGLDGAPKPSYFTVRREHAPLVVERRADGLRLTCRMDLPRYAVRGYLLETVAGRRSIPDLAPGESWLCPDCKGPARVLRPNGDLALEIGEE